MAAFKLLLDVVGVVFVNVQNYKLLGVVGCYLAAELASYRAASARDKHHPVLDIAHNFVEVDLYLVAAEKVGNLHLAQRGDTGIAVYYLVNAR